MALAIEFLGHSGFLLDDGKNRLAIDPFLTGNPVAKKKPADVKCQYIAITHGHEDHVGDTVAIAKSNDATVIAAWEITHLMSAEGVKKTEPGNPGGRIQTDFGWVAFVQAFHSSSYKGQYMGQPCGLVVRMGGATVYHCGDTGLFGDMRLIGEIYKPDVALIPIGDRFTMDAALATKAAEFIKPKVAIPMHYKTFGMLAQSADGFEPKGVEVKELAPGETWRFGG